MKVETVVVETENGPVIVNAEDAHMWEQKPASDNSGEKQRGRKKRGEDE